jgi:hypothetical protein
MPIAQLPGNLRLYYEDDNFTDPWAPSETVILHHGNAKNSQLWYAWVPRLVLRFRISVLVLGLALLLKWEAG